MDVKDKHEIEARVRVAKSLGCDAAVPVSLLERLLARIEKLEGLIHEAECAGSYVHEDGGLQSRRSVPVVLQLSIPKRSHYPRRGLPGVPA